MRGMKRPGSHLQSDAARHEKVEAGFTRREIDPAVEDEAHDVVDDDIGPERNLSGRKRQWGRGWVGGERGKDHQLGCRDAALPSR